MKKDEAIKQYYETLCILRRSRSTVSTYTSWVRQYIDFLATATCPASATREERIGKFLSRIVIRGNVSATTQKQALCAIIGFYKLVMKEPVGDLTFSRSSRPKFLPAVFSREEVWRVLDNLYGVGWIHQLFLGLNVERYTNTFLDGVVTMSKPLCIFYRNWFKNGMPDWCICNWNTCSAMGQECPDETPAIAPEKLRQEDTKEAP